MRFFRTWANLKFNILGYRPEFKTVDVENMDKFITPILNDKQATLHELQTIYSLEDAFKLNELVLVSRFNQYLAAKQAENKMNRRA